MRVVVISQVAPAAHFYATALRAAGHEPVALLCIRGGVDRYGGGAALDAAPANIDVVVPAARDRMAPLLRACEPDEAFCMGDPQSEDGASYYSFFEPEYAKIDWSRPAAEIERQVRAWRFHSPTAGERGALAEIDGETVRVLRVSLEPAEGRARECGEGTLWLVEWEPA